MKDLSGRRRDIMVGVAILLILAAGFWFFKLRKPQLKVTENTQSIQEVEKGIEDRFNINVPDNVEKAQLSDVSGGDGSGIAIRNEILADLPDPVAGYFYQAWLEKDGKLVSLGKMMMEKGGWLTTYSSNSYPGYNKVVVSLEKVFDRELEKRILEGSF